MKARRKKLRLMPKPWYPSLIADEIEPVYPMESYEPLEVRIEFIKKGVNSEQENEKIDDGS